MPSALGLQRAWIYALMGDSVETRSAISELLAGDPGLVYRIMPGSETSVVRRLMTEEELRVAFLTFSHFLPGECRNQNSFCARAALHEEAAGSKEVARVYWDSLAVTIQELPSEQWSRRVHEALLYQGLGRKGGSNQGCGGPRTAPRSVGGR